VGSSPLAELEKFEPCDAFAMKMESPIFVANFVDAFVESWPNSTKVSTKVATKGRLRVFFGTDLVTTAPVVRHVRYKIEELN